jgi:biofilm protein TabA
VIFDSIAYLEQYRGKIPCVDGILAFLDKADQLKEGRYDFDGGFVLVQEGTTRPPEQAQFEAHDAYADLQLICRGGERVEWADRAALPEAVAYDADKDIAFFHGSGVAFDLMPGMFYAVFPHDAHKPGCHMGGERPVTYRKLVFKFKV